MPDVWEYREPQDRHPQTQPAAAVPQDYSQDEHLRRLAGPQVDAPRHQPLPGYEQTGQLHATPPQYTPPRQVSWVSAHKGVTAALSVCALTVAGAAVFALLPSGSGSPGPSAAAAAAGVTSSRGPDRQAGSTGAAQPAAAVTVTGTAKTVRTGAKVTAGPRATAPSAKAGPSAHPTATGSGPAPVVTGTSPVGDDRTTAPVSPPPSPPPVSPPPTPPPPTCTVTSSIPEVQATVTTAEPATATESFDVSEYGPATPAGTAGALVAQVVISVPGPLTAGEVVTGEGAANASAYSCAVTGVSVNGN